jgi:hypothetical protein
MTILAVWTLSELVSTPKMARAQRQLTSMSLV